MLSTQLDVKSVMVSIMSVGETLRAVGVTRKEHQDEVHLGDSVKLAERVHECVKPHVIDWESLTEIEQSRRWKDKSGKE